MRAARRHGPAAIGARERMRPVMMTAAVAAFGFVLLLLADATTR